MEFFLFSLVLPLLFFALGIPLFREKIGRNTVYGVRNARTMVSDRDWYRFNKTVGKAIAFSSGVSFCLTCVFWWFLTCTDLIKWLVFVILQALVLLFSLFVSVSYEEKKE